MKLSKQPFWPIKRAFDRASAHEVDLDWNFLAAHRMAGGNVDSLVEGIIFAKATGLVLPHHKASGFELVAGMAHGLSLKDYLGRYTKEGIRDFTHVSLSGTKNRAG